MAIVTIGAAVFFVAAPQLEPACGPAAPIDLPPQRPLVAVEPTAKFTPVEPPTIAPSAGPPVEVVRPFPSPELVEPTRSASVAADPEEELIGGNVDLATRALKLAQMRAASAPGLAEYERETNEATRRQAQRLEAAGYPKEPPR